MHLNTFIISYVIFTILCGTSYAQDRSYDLRPFNPSLYYDVYETPEHETSEMGLILGKINTTQETLTFLRTNPIDFEKPFIVFLHGHSSRKEFFLNQFTDLLLKKANLISFDLLGHGESSNLENTSDDAITPQAKCIAEALDQMDIQQNVLFVGYGLGAQISLILRDLYPETKTLGIYVLKTLELADLDQAHETKPISWQNASELGSIFTKKSKIPLGILYHYEDNKHEYEAMHVLSELCEAISFQGIYAKDSFISEPAVSEYILCHLWESLCRKRKATKKIVQQDLKPEEEVPTTEAALTRTSDTTEPQKKNRITSALKRLIPLSVPQWMGYL